MSNLFALFLRIDLVVIPSYIELPWDKERQPFSNILNLPKAFEFPLIQSAFAKRFSLL